MELEFSGKIIENYSNSSTMKILIVEAGLFHAYRQTDRQKETTKPIVAFRSFGYIWLWLGLTTCSVKFSQTGFIIIFGLFAIQ
jgi:hypothetical protein